MSQRKNELHQRLQTGVEIKKRLGFYKHLTNCETEENVRFTKHYLLYNSMSKTETREQIYKVGLYRNNMSKSEIIYI